MRLRKNSELTLTIFIITFIFTYSIAISFIKKENIRIFHFEKVSNTITLAFVGDLMCHMPQINASLNDSHRIDFEPVFELVKDYLSSANFTVGNLETTIGDTTDKFSGYPKFRSPNEYLIALKNSGFDLLFLGNNHILDFGESGIKKTIKYLKKYNLAYTGAFESFNDYDSIRIYDVGKFKVCFIAATYGLNGNLIPPLKEYLVNIINLDSLKNQIIKAKKLGSNLIVVNLHFGEEYSFIPNHFQENVVDSLISFGADIIIGNHPHVLQPIKIIKSINSKIDSVVIAYSLGNFLSNQRDLKTSTGAILFITIEQPNQMGKIKLNKVKILPTYVFKGLINKQLRYKIIPLTDEIINSDSLTPHFTSNKILKQAYELSKKILLLNIGQTSEKIEIY